MSKPSLQDKIEASIRFTIAISVLFLRLSLLSISSKPIREKLIAEPSVSYCVDQVINIRKGCVATSGIFNIKTLAPSEIKTLSSIAIYANKISFYKEDFSKVIEKVVTEAAFVRFQPSVRNIRIPAIATIVLPEHILHYFDAEDISKLEQFRVEFCHSPRSLPTLAYDRHLRALIYESNLRQKAAKFRDKGFIDQARGTFIRQPLDPLPPQVR